MPNSVITAAGLALFARAQAEGLTVTIDKMIFADVPDLDPEQTPNPAAGLPPAGQIVFEGDIEYTGKLADDTVVYSRILAATEGTFYLNWIGLYSTEHATLVAVCVVHRHKKYATDGFRAGNTLYKNFAIQYANASALTGIVIEAESWQFDLSTRYALIDHNHDDRYEPWGEVADHNGAEDPHPGKFEAAGAVAGHNQAAGAHGRSGMLAASGYEKLPGGLIVQWGTITPATTGDDITDVQWEANKQAFPVAFPTVCCSLSAARRQIVVGEGISVDSATVTRFDNTHFYIIDRHAANRPFTWIATGY